MVTKAAVLYKGALAHYRVRKEENGGFTAQLLLYKGSAINAPPKEVHFVKDGRHCTGNTGEQELMDDLYETVKTRFGGLLSRANGYHL
ncbi:MAG TPA: hypothetical protein VD794_08050 [Flavisolibacter sp.]|nr:hypothetical protein [Flavisolibacter sp.]